MDFPEVSIYSLQALPPIALLRAALRRLPHSRDARLRLTVALLQAGLFPEAAQHGGRLVEQDKDDLDSCYLYSWALIGRGECEAVLSRWKYVEGALPYVKDLGRLACRLNQWECGYLLLAWAWDRAPGDIPLSQDLAVSLAQTGHLWEADRLLLAISNRKEISPTSLLELQFHRSKLQLLQGHFDAGFELYESRRVFSGVKDSDPLEGVPVWQNEPLQGKTIVVREEQGFGDSIQGIRFCKNLFDLGATVHLECRTVIRSLLNSAEGVVGSFLRGNCPFLPDFQIPLMSLPHRFQWDPLRFPAPSPYLKIPSAGSRFVDINKALAKAQGSFKVGLVWQGNPSHVRDSERSLPAALLPRLGLPPQVAYFSLQQEPLGWPNFPITDLGSLIQDFSDLAFALNEIDLLITVDTAAAHLAGALGRPAWVLLPFFPDWRWQMQGTTTPWYPTLKLWRQPRPGAWLEVLDDVSLALDLLPTKG